MISPPVPPPTGVPASKGPAPVGAGGESRPKRPYVRTKPTKTDLLAPKIEALRSQNVPHRKIAKMVGVSARLVAEVLRRPGARERIDILRERNRQHAIAQITAIQPKVWEQIERALNEGDSKAFDAYTRGAAAMERIAAGAAGENRQVTQSLSLVQNTVNVDGELTQLLSALGMLAPVIEAERVG